MHIISLFKMTIRGKRKMVRAIALMVSLLTLELIVIFYCMEYICTKKVKIDESTLEKTLMKKRKYWGSGSALNEGNKFSFHRTLLNQRNELSLLLNVARQTIGQLECSAKTKGEVANSGGWCEEDSGPDSSQHATDTEIVKYLADFFKDMRVASFGDGPGIYKNYFDGTGLLKVYDAYDGAPYSPRSTTGRVDFLDLSTPQYGLPIYDWVLSLEVAEHIPEKYQDVFLSNIVRHAKTGVILSWAEPGQDGYHHVNNRDLSFVVGAMETLGFERNVSESKLLQSHCTLSWLAKNTNVYVRREDHPINEYDA